jgi:hypothetical protein
MHARTPWWGTTGDKPLAKAEATVDELNRKVMRQMQELIQKDQPDAVDKGYWMIEFYLHDRVCDQTLAWSNRWHLGLRAFQMPTVWQNVNLTLREYVRLGKFKVAEDLTPLLIHFGQWRAFDCLRGREFRVDDEHLCNERKLFGGKADDATDSSGVIIGDHDESGSDDWTGLDGPEPHELGSVIRYIVEVKLRPMHRLVIKTRVELTEKFKRDPTMEELTDAVNDASNGTRSVQAMTSLLHRAREKILYYLDAYRKRMLTDGK